MKIQRSSKCHFDHLTAYKKQKMCWLLDECARLSNMFIEKYDQEIINEKKGKFYFLSSAIYGQFRKETTLTSNFLQVIFAEAYSMVEAASEAAKATQRQYVRPRHHGRKIMLSSAVVDILVEPKMKEFDLAVRIKKIGSRQLIVIPLKRHRQFNKWMQEGKLCRSLVLTRDRIQFSFEVQTGQKKTSGELVGIDLGLKTLMTLSNGELHGTQINKKIEELRRKKTNSKAYKRKKIEIKEYSNKEIKSLNWQNYGLVVVENLKNIKHKMRVKRRLTKNIRARLSHWNAAHVLRRIQELSEENRVSFRRVPSFYTSQKCSRCSHRDKNNRISQEEFKCQSCGYADNADHNAALNILDSGVTGKYGFRFKESA